MGDKRAGGGGRKSGGKHPDHDRHAPAPEDRPRRYMPATALAAMRFYDLTEPEKIVPEISVRIPSTAPCSEPAPCLGIPEKRHSCGPSPPESKTSFDTCGLPMCYNEDICSCRCYCSLRKDMLRAEDSGTVPAMGEIDEVLPRPGTITKVHVARIRGLEPRPPVQDVERFPAYYLCRNHLRHIRMARCCCRPCRCPSHRYPFVLPRLCEKRHYCGGSHVSTIGCMF